jgi:hypothetical protein
MHFAFVPVTADKKRGGFKVSAKEVLTRRDLQSFHQDLSREMSRVFTRDVGIENGIVKERGGELSISQLKEQSSRAEDLRTRNDALEAAISRHYDKQKQELDQTDAMRRKLLEDAKMGAIAILTRAKTEASRITGDAIARRDEAQQELDNALREAQRAAGATEAHQAQIESLRADKSALEGEITALEANLVTVRGKAITEARISAIGEVVRPPFGKPRFQCSPEEADELKQAARGNYALAQELQNENSLRNKADRRAEVAEERAKEFERRIPTMAKRRRDEEIREQRDSLLAYLKKIGRVDHYLAEQDMIAFQREQSRRHDGYER